MGDVLLPDRPPLVDDNEVLIGRLVRSWTWLKMADAVNWLNFYARKVLPYQRFGSTTVSQAAMIYPCDGPAITRYLTVIAGCREFAGSAKSGLTVTSSTDATGVGMDVFQSAGGVSTPTDSAVGHEQVITYGVAHVEITADQRELVTLTPATDVKIDGWGAWELPAGMYRADGAGGLTAHTAIANSAWTSVGLVDPDHFLAGREIDTNGVEYLHDAMVLAEGYNRPILFVAGNPGDTNVLNWHTNSPANNGSYVSLPTGGIYIPPTAIRTSATSRAIRVAAYIKNDAAGNSAWRVNTSQGTYGGSSPTTTTGSWRGASGFGASPFDPTQNGVLARVATSGEWITIDLREDSGANADPHISAVCIWDAGA